MCGRFTLRRHYESVRRELYVEASGGAVIHEPRYNIAPTQQALILTTEAARGRQVSTMTWGIPRQRGARMVRQINTRAESVSPRSTRCAVIADGFYEWTGAKGPARQPYWFHRPDDGLILMAGLWQWYRRIDEGFERTFAIVTTAANSLMAPIHDRMPAILEGDALAMWLNPKSTASDLPGLIGPAREDLLQMRAVSLRVNHAKNDGPELLAPDKSRLFEK